MWPFSLITITAEGGILLSKKADFFIKKLEIQKNNA
jgi:hypothetical protein